MTDPAPSVGLDDDAELAASVSASRGGVWLRRYGWMAVPSLILLLGSAQFVRFLVPNTDDNQVIHSCQPLKALRFFHSKGQDVHKWGPLPNVLHAPAFGGLLAYWKLTGALGRPSGDYPYGLKRPHEQLGAMIVAGRLVILVLGMVSMAWLTWALGRASKVPLLAVFAMLAMAATEPQLVVRMASTCVDGPMMVFLGLATGFYVLIIYEGLTRLRGVLLSISAVCAISCKELAVPLFILTYIGIAVRGWRQTRGARAERRTFLTNYAVTVGAGIGSYLLINVIYCPGSWLQRMDLVFLGTLKDPSIWADPRQTTLSYLAATGIAVVGTLGFGGTLLLVLAAVLSIWLRPRHALMAWLPFISHVAIVWRSAGYMPEYFMLPLTYLGALVLVVVFGESVPLLRQRFSSSLGLKVLAGVGLAALVVDAVGGWGMATATRHASYNYMAERYVVEHVPRETSVGIADFAHRNPGASRLAYLGYEADDRSAGEWAAQRTSLPQVVIADQEWLDWTRDMKLRPARAAATTTEWSGFYDYSQFPGFEAMGYRKALTIGPELPGWIQLQLWPLGCTIPVRTMVVYER